MNRYTSNADSVETRALTAHDAAAIIARRLYGRRGVCASLRRDSRSADGRERQWEAYVGKPNRYGGVPGRNIWIFERVAQEG
jgi:hypothetical protein